MTEGFLEHVLLSKKRYDQILDPVALDFGLTR